MAKREFLDTGRWAIVDERKGVAQRYIKELLELPEHVYPIVMGKIPPRAWGSYAPLYRRNFKLQNELAAMAREQTGGRRGCLVAVPDEDVQCIALRLKDTQCLIKGFYSGSSQPSKGV